MPDIWGLAAIVTKFLLYLGVLTAAGTVFVTLVFRLQQTRGLCLVCAGLGIMAALLSFMLQGANLTGDARGMIDPDMLGLLWGTQVGTALVLRLCGLGLLIFTVVIRRDWLAALGGLLAIWSFVQVGHVAGRDAVLLQGALAVHISVAAFWIGILTPLMRLASQAQSWPEAALLGQRFGHIALGVVPLLIMVGLAMGYALVGSFSSLITTAYGLALIIKVGLVACVLGVAAANKLRFIPGLLAQDPTAGRALVRSIRAEWALFCVILVVTALLTSHLTLPSVD